MLSRTKPPKCKHCKDRTDSPSRLLHEDCIEPWLQAQNANKLRLALRKQRLEDKIDRAITRKRKQEIKTIPDLIKEAQREFNAYIRLRDRLAGHSCISSGLPLDWSGNAVDAGHYRSTGAAPWLRFNEDNCHAQSKQENRYLSGNAADYRIGLIARIGPARVEALETESGAGHKWTREALIAIRDTYRARAKELRKGVK